MQYLVFFLNEPNAKESAAMPASEYVVSAAGMPNEIPNLLLFREADVCVGYLSKFSVCLLLAEGASKCSPCTQPAPSCCGHGEPLRSTA